MVKETKSPRGERALQEAIAQGFLTGNGEKSQDLTIPEDKNGHIDDQKSSRKPSKAKFSKFPTPIIEEVYKSIKLNRKAMYSWLQDNIRVSEATIKCAISDLKEPGYFNKEHSKIKGKWQLLK